MDIDFQQQIASHQQSVGRLPSQRYLARPQQLNCFYEGLADDPQPNTSMVYQPQETCLQQPESMVHLFGEPTSQAGRWHATKVDGFSLEYTPLTTYIDASNNCQTLSTGHSGLYSDDPSRGFYQSNQPECSYPPYSRNNWQAQAAEASCHQFVNYGYCDTQQPHQQHQLQSHQHQQQQQENIQDKPGYYQPGHCQEQYDSHFAYNAANVADHYQNHTGQTQASLEGSVGEPVADRAYCVPGSETVIASSQASSWAPLDQPLPRPISGADVAMAASHASQRKYENEPTWTPSVTAEHRQQQQQQQPHYRFNTLTAKSECKSSRGSGMSSVRRHNQCEVCGRNYARPSTLKTHLRTHTNERPFKCNVCLKTFSQAANLTAHQRVHTGKLPPNDWSHVCGLELTSDTGQLGERPFSCPICGRQFSQSSSVITHLRTHSGERPYRCSMCSRTFSDSSTLTKHCRIHSGEKPYQCDYCPLNFSQSGNLSRHLKLHLANADSTSPSDPPSIYDGVDKTHSAPSGADSNRRPDSPPKEPLRS